MSDEVEVRPLRMDKRGRPRYKKTNGTSTVYLKDIKKELKSEK